MTTQPNTGVDPTGHTNQHLSIRNGNSPLPPISTRVSVARATETAEVSRITPYPARKGNTGGPVAFLKAHITSGYRPLPLGPEARRTLVALSSGSHSVELPLQAHQILDPPTPHGDVILPKYTSLDQALFREVQQKP